MAQSAVVAMVQSVVQPAVTATRWRCLRASGRRALSRLVPMRRWRAHYNDAWTPLPCSAAAYRF